MKQKSKKFIESFMGDYIGETQEGFLENNNGLMKKSKKFKNLCEKDLLFAKELYDKQDSQESRRIYIRSSTAFVEGWLNFLRIIPHFYPPLLARIPMDCLVLFSEPILWELKERKVYFVLLN